MPEPAEPGVKSPSGPPSEGSGASLSGPPPEDDLVFEDDEVIEQDGKKMVPLEALIKARKDVRSRPATPPPPPPPPQPQDLEEPSPEPLFNWDKLVQSNAAPQPGQSGQQMPQMSPEQFEDNFRDMLNDRPWQAIMWAMQTGMQMRDRMENQARSFVPDYTNLPIHEISDQEVMAIAQNPYALKALVAKSRAVGGKAKAAGNPPTANVPGAGTNPQDIAAQVLQLLSGQARQAGLSGESTGGPSSPPAARGDDLQLDENSVKFLKARGYTNEQIKAHAQRILEKRRQRGLA